MGSNVIIVGSGAGGATVARELAIRGKNVTIVEAGKYHKLGTETEANKFYSGSMLKVSETSEEGTEVFRTIMAGGSTMVTLGNGVRSSLGGLKAAGISLKRELKESEKELGVAPLPERLMGERTKKLMLASERLGYEMKPMPKFIDFNRCQNCGMCVLGCRYGAKWTSLNFLGEARKAGAKLLLETKTEKVLNSKGEVKGISVLGPEGPYEIPAETVVLSAGGIGTPIILQNSGLSHAGTNLFADLYVNTYGLLEEGKMEEEMGMGAVIDEFHESHGFILSPALDLATVMLMYFPFFKKLRSRARNRTLGLMTKIADDDAGRVDADGRIHKPVTENDREKLDKGDKAAREIIVEAGADPKSLYTTKVFSAHPGGTAGVGRVVDANQETEISRLFVNDASILPSALGAPPVLTLVALSKRFTRILASEYL